MRRADMEIKDRAEIDAVIRCCKVCRLGLCAEGEAYIVPMCFGYDGEALYFHGAEKGKKIDMLRENPRVCFEFDVLDEVAGSEKACDWDMHYRSVIGFGTAELLDDTAAKEEALQSIMSQYTKKAFTFPEKMVQHTCVIRVTIESVTGKQSA